MHSARPWQTWLGPTLVALQFVVLDISLRGKRYAHDWRAWLAAASSIGLWLLLGLAARTRIARAVVSAFAAVTLVSELTFYRYYHTFIADDAIRCARSMWQDIRPVLGQMLPQFVLSVLLVAALEFWLLTRAPRPTLVRLGRFVALGLGLAAGSTSAVPWGPPELRTLWSLRLLFHEREAAAHVRISVPPLESRLARLPNVLIILNESVRARDYSLAQLEAANPVWRTVVPSRVELTSMHSLSSYTSIAINALLSGVMPLGESVQVAATPLLFDFVHAVQTEKERVRTLYWSVQGASSFERAAPRAMADSVAFFDDVVGNQYETIEELVALGADPKLADYVARQLPAQPLPLLLLAHLTDTHAPYHVDESVTPFQPYSHTVSWAGLTALHNAYNNAIVAQDRSVLAIVQAFIAKAGTEPYVVFFVSDHGEAFGEHDAIHHGQNLYDEQIHVPAWIAFGNGAFTMEQQGWLRSHANEFTTHLDLLPTLLDIYGVHDAFGIIGQQKKLLGRSLLRPFTEPSLILPITNCTKLFACPLQNYGLIKDGITLQAQPWDDTWRCVGPSPKSEPLPLDAAPCVELHAASKALYPLLPNGAANR